MNNEHGADLYEISNELNISKNELIDFSSNINPFGISKKSFDFLKENLNLATIYPDTKYSKLKESISKYCNCSPENIILGSGATELISSTIKLFNPKNVLLLSPAYSEYEKELKKINTKITKFFYEKENNFEINIDDLVDLIKKNDFDMIVICNPNNPTGNLISVENLKKLCFDENILIMIDETYIEFTDTSKTSATTIMKNYDNIVVIRGTSKFFSTPGIRLGYAISSEKNVKKFEEKISTLWNINIFACILGEIMFTDNEFISMCHKKFKENFSLLFNGLKKHKEIKVYNSSSNFILCEILSDDVNATMLYEYLLKKNIVIRKTESFENLSDKFFRVCVLSEENINLLLQEINIFFITYQM